MNNTYVYIQVLLVFDTYIVLLYFLEWFDYLSKLIHINLKTSIRNLMSQFLYSFHFYYYFNITYNNYF